MPKPSRKPKSPNTQHEEGIDPSVAEVDMATDPPEDGKNPAAVALGRLGGKKGGIARAKKLTPEQRREIAKKAAAARWRKTS